MAFHSEVAQAAADHEHLVATDLAEVLVEDGVPFRQAHERVGKLVAEALSSGRTLREVIADDPDAAQFVGLFEPGASLARRRSPGASGPLASGAQAIRLHNEIEELTARL
jgi:argininosuccinate lyase